MSSKEVARPGWLTLKDAAAYLGVTETWMRRQVKYRTIEHNKLGNVIRFRISVLDALIAANEVEADVPLRQHPGRAGYPRTKRRRHVA